MRGILLLRCLLREDVKVTAAVGRAIALSGVHSFKR